MAVRAAIIVGFLLFSPMVARGAGAQTLASGAIAGLVNDASGGVLPGVIVEAASPALIEKVRSVTTDSQGLYKIVDLRPGVYSLTVQLPGFKTVKREGLTLTTAFTMTINVVLEVGTVEETVVVTGASPVVDVQNVRTQQVLSHSLLDALPSSKDFQIFEVLVPGITDNRGTWRRDVGGSSGANYAGFQSHGTDPGFNSLDGLTIINLQSPEQRRYATNDNYIQEVVLQTSGGSAETWTSGVTTNVVIKDGGKQFGGMLEGAYTGAGLDANNLDDALRARGLTTVNGQKYVYSAGGTLGGPLAKDKLWFFVTPRRWGNAFYVAGIYYNATPHTLFYKPDLSRQSFFDQDLWDVSGRLTWQVTQKDKITISSLNGNRRSGHFGLASGNTSPDGDYASNWGPTNNAIVTWTRPATSRLLFEVGAAYQWANAVLSPTEAASVNDRSVTDTALGLRYGSNFSGALGSGNNADYKTDPQRTLITRGTMSYITGPHSLRVGFTTYTASEEITVMANSPTETYTFNNGVPTSLTQLAIPHTQNDNVKMFLGLFAQDQWTLRRATINAGLRFDAISGYSPMQTRPAGVYTSAVTYPEANNIPSWKDLNPRLGVAYDLFGTGKTALKVSLGRYEAFNNYSASFTRNNSPELALTTQASRTWNDGFYPVGDPRRGNYVPDCDLQNKLANGECGQLSDLNFGSTAAVTTYADSLKTGWGVSPYVWSGAVAVQQQLAPNVGLVAGYYHTWYGNFYMTDNLSVTPDDYTSYCVTAPIDSRLPGGGGSQICGLYDVSKAKFGQVQNQVVAAPNRSQVYNGVDATVNARFGRGVSVMGGFATGRTASDMCQTPDAPTLFCRTVLPWKQQAEYKASLVYPLPWWGLQMGVTYRNLPGTVLAGTFVATNAQIAPVLGRNLAACPTATGACTQTVTVTMVEPNTLSEERGNQTDLRASKIFRLGPMRLQANVDLANVFNANDVLSVTTRYSAATPATWLKPASIMAGRLIKFGAQLDF